MCVTHLVYSYRSKVQNGVWSDDHEANEKRNDSQVESLPTQPLRAVIVLLIVALLGLWGEGKIKFILWCLLFSLGGWRFESHWDSSYANMCPHIRSEWAGVIFICSKYLERNDSPPCFASTFFSPHLPFLLSIIQICIEAKVLSSGKQWIAVAYMPHLVTHSYNDATAAVGASTLHKFVCLSSDSSETWDKSKCVASI